MHIIGIYLVFLLFLKRLSTHEVINVSSWQQNS